MLDYTLAPEEQFPFQLKEARACYEYLTSQLGETNILLAGDSAGGNLAISLLAHLKHQHPQIPAVMSETRPIGVVLLSPWVEICPPPSRSIFSSAKKDNLSWEALEYWGDAFCSDHTLRRTEWVSPGRASCKFWHGVFPENVLVVIGEDEVMKDDITEWCGQVQIEPDKILIEADMPHDSLVSQFLWKSKTERQLSPSLGRVVDSLRTALSSSGGSSSSGKTSNGESEL